MLPFDIRLTADTGEILTAHNLIDTWNKSISYDFGTNFDINYLDALKNVSDFHNTLYYAIIFAAILISILLILIVIYKSIKKFKHKIETGKS